MYDRARHTNLTAVRCASDPFTQSCHLFVFLKQMSTHTWPYECTSESGPRRDIPKQFIRPRIASHPPSPRSSSPLRLARWGGGTKSKEAVACRPFTSPPPLDSPPTPSTTRAPDGGHCCLSQRLATLRNCLRTVGSDQSLPPRRAEKGRLHSLLPSHTSHLIAQQRDFTPCARPSHSSVIQRRSDRRAVAPLKRCMVRYSVSADARAAQN
jgi:hypothetical protein